MESRGGAQVAKPTTTLILVANPTTTLILALALTAYNTGRWGDGVGGDDATAVKSWREFVQRSVQNSAQNCGVLLET